MRKLFSLAMTAVAIGEGALAVRGLLRRIRHRRMVENGEAFEVKTPEGEIVICKPVGEGDSSDANPKPHQDKPSQMGLAG